MERSSPHSPPGIHHVSAICGDPQGNLDFYTGLLGLRLVKTTVNYDDPGTYHLYYGDGHGSPGTLLTFFAWILPPMVTARGHQGTGQIVATAFAIPAGAVDYWVDRLAAAAVDFDGPTPRFGEPVISFLDPDGLPLELVARDPAAGRSRATDMGRGSVPPEHAIRALAGATLCLDGYESTAALLTGTLGFREVGSEGSRFRFQVGEAESAAMIDLLCRPEGDPGRMGIGTVHHIAWRAPGPEAQRELRALLAAAGLDVTPVLDRRYFESVYCREPGGVLLEVATDGPGFTIDEALEDLGTELKLPPWLEARRERIVARLPGLRLPRRTDPDLLAPSPQRA